MSVLLTENFEAYAVRGISDAALGVWSCYQVGLEAGTGHGGSKAAVSYQGALSIAGLNSPVTARWGRTVAWNYRLSIAELAARGRGSQFYRGINIQPTPAVYDGAYMGFGLTNDPSGASFGSGHPNDMVLWTNWRAGDGSTGQFVTYSTPNIVVDSVWQQYDFRWKLSSVSATSPFLNADGCVQLYVDSVLVLDTHGLYLTLYNNTGPTVLNQWDGVYYALGGLVDDVTISNDALVCADQSVLLATIPPTVVMNLPTVMLSPDLPPLEDPPPRALIGGYFNQPMRIVRHEMDPDTLKCTITLFDLGALYAGSFVLGPDTLTPSWPDAHNLEQERYGYLSNDVGLYSDNVPGKVLR